MHNAVPQPPLPDVAFDAVPLERPLDWVGMDGMALPVRVDGVDGLPKQVAATVAHATGTYSIPPKR